ncbi:hypothetical protein [Hymenobacter sp. 5414T-23]|uniref:hypothetical protein n=1 Tax=Hymenobacter sp. 5414T-23 TaxID=2932252 RepID=UPI00293E72A9|nr:hypothetical protein [Hymenobacter sp. 5414T-23]
MRISSLCRSVLLAAMLPAVPLVATAQSARINTIDSLNIRKIYDEALAHGQSYANLRELTGTIGGA